MLKEIINFSAKFESLETVNPLITKYRINICVPNKPANRYIFSKEVIEGMANTIRGAGVYAYYFEQEKQIGGHQNDSVKTKYGYKRTGVPMAYGFADPYKEPYWLKIDNEEWYCADVYLWTGRNPEIEEVLEKPVYQSMEVCVNEQEDENHNKIVTEAMFLGFCLLQGIEPAFSNSHIEKFSFSNHNIKSEVEQLKKEFELFASKYDDLDFTIPSGAIKTAKRGLELRKEFGYGGTSVGLASARKLSKGGTATPEFVRKVSAYFPRHMGDNLDENGKDEKPPSRGYIAYCLWGGDVGRRWSTKLVEAMNKRDEEKMSYFAIDNESIDNSEVIDNINLKSENFLKQENKQDGDNGIKEAVEKFSLNSSQIHEILNNALAEYKYGENEWRKYWTYCFDETYAYVEDSENCKTYRMTYDIVDNIATINIESKEEVIRGGYVPVGESQENMTNEEMAKEDESENKEEDSKEEEKSEESKTEDMSSNAYVDNTAMQEINDKSAESNKELANENMEVSDDRDNIIAGLKAELSELQEKLSKVEADMTVYMNENTELKAFKANIEKQNKEFEVEMTLKEVMSVLPKEEIEACRMSAETFSVDNINIWKNEVQAKAFKFSKNIPEKAPYMRVGFPNTDKPKRGSGLWD